MAERDTLEKLVQGPKARVVELFETGKAPDPESLVDYEFRGFNLPLITKILGFQKFRKGFYRVNAEYWGYNIPVRQGRLENPWDCRPSNENPRRFGYYLIEHSSKVPGAFEPDSLLLDYSKGKNGLFEGSFLRDYLRMPDANNPDLLIGKAYTLLAGVNFGASYFVVQRDRRAPTPVEHRF